ncbi:MAG TPA: hypothetical protein PK816_13160 [Candidatus Cloacimonadota bacterium]|nr:hypothetical protein [Candidatus Cloacimonadota bacterium]
MTNILKALESIAIIALAVVIMHGTITITSALNEKEAVDDFTMTLTDQGYVVINGDTTDYVLEKHEVFKLRSK